MDRAQLNSADAVHPIRETPERLARIVGGELIQAGGSALSCSGLALDSRKVQPGELFVALRGPRFDAHEFLGDAIARGAAGLIVERAPKLELPSGVFAIVVPHARQALIDMARARRAQLDIPVFAITGTCGKTSTKEMLRHLLEGCCHVYASPKSFNNEIGLPWTLLQAPEDCGALVLEIGTNGPGEIAALSDLARPTLGCVTMAGRGHLERLGTIDGVAHEKSALLAGPARRRRRDPQCG
jgi:UDP-N-acetylmuramoyl-tripeptide--D-alanyl-D-alanine ligase